MGQTEREEGAPGAAGCVSGQAVEDYYNGPLREKRMEAQRRVLEASFGAVQAKCSGAVYDELHTCYAHAQVVYDDAALTPAARQNLLYRIYDRYFEQLAALPWAVRRAVKADRHIRQMRAAVKKEEDPGASLRYWMLFAKRCLPFFAAGMAGELLLLWDTGPGVPLWRTVLWGLLMIVGFGGYVVAAYELEGQRLHGGLQKWLLYRLYPKEYSRPLDIVQGAKLALPLVIAVGGALLKQYL